MGGKELKRIAHISLSSLKGTSVAMPAFLDVVEGQFGTRDLYAVLGVGKEAGDRELRKAYHRLSLKVHPDRVESDDVAKATEKFQVCLKYNIVGHLTNQDI